MRRKLRRFYPFFILAPFVALVLFFSVNVLASDYIIFPLNNPFPPGARYVSNQIIVKYKEGKTPEALDKSGKMEEKKSLDKELFEIGVISQERLFLTDDILLKNYYLLNLRPNSNIPEVYKQLMRVSQVDSITPDYILSTQAAPDDPFFTDGQQWDMRKINLENAWNIQKGKINVTVGVIDTGVDTTNEDLKGVVKKGENEITGNSDTMDDQGHGTHVAGTIAALTNNGIGVSSVSWGNNKNGVRILPVKVCGSDGNCVTSDIVKGVKYAANNGAKIINLSISGAGECGTSNPFDFNNVYNSAISYARSKGALVVVAAGNEGQNASQVIPAKCSGVLVVGATNPDNGRWIGPSKQSNFGSLIKISAPGENILSTGMGNTYVTKSGTSMAAPHVSGLAALLLSYKPNLTPDQLTSCIINGADAIKTDEPIGKLINAQKALQRCGAPVIKASPTPKPSPTISLTPTPLPSPLPGSYFISGVVFADKGPVGNGILDPGEVLLSNVQVILSPADLFTSSVSNSVGYYTFRDLSPIAYTLTLSVQGIPSVNLPITPVTLTNTNRSQIVNIPILESVIPVPVVTQAPGVTTAPRPTNSQSSSSGCYIDPACLSGKKTVQVCAFKCN